MIISERHKYIFVGIPFSASTAISKELCEMYEGGPILTKHSNIPELARTTNINLADYRIAACLRNPYEMTYTYYTKLKDNPRNIYYDPKFFFENGGHVRKKARNRHQMVISKNLSFEEYISYYMKLPYDSYYSLNKPFLNFTIDFHDINDSFQKFLNFCGIDIKRNLPVTNKSNKKEIEIDFYDQSKMPNTFRPFLAEHGSSINFSEVKTSFWPNKLYKLMKPARFAYWKYLDSQRQIEKYGTYYDLVKKHEQDY